MAKSALLIEMIDLLRDRPGVTVSELATALQRSERTVYRWLNDISTGLHMPITCKDGGYYLSDRNSGKRIDLNPQELLALSLSLKSSPFQDGSPVREHAELAWLKIREAATEGKLDEVETLSASHSVCVKALPGDVDKQVVGTIHDAVVNRQRLRVVYRSQKSDKVKPYIIDPYAVVFRRHSWYVVGYCAEHEDIVQFRLVRFASAINTGIEFEPPSDFSVDDYFALSWEAWGGGEPVKVRVRFSRHVAKMIAETRRHPTQVVYPEPDGGAVMEVTVSGTKEIAIWIMGYGKDAEVLMPPSLRAYVASHARGMFETYISDEDEALRELHTDSI